MKVSSEILENEKDYTKPIGQMDMIPFDRIELMGQCHLDRIKSGDDEEQLCKPLDKDDISLIGKLNQNEKE